MDNAQLLEKAKALKSEMEKRLDAIGADIESSQDLDEFENISFAIQQMIEVIDALECNE